MIPRFLLGTCSTSGARVRNFGVTSSITCRGIRSIAHNHVRDEGRRVISYTRASSIHAAYFSVLGRNRHASEARP